MRLLDLLLSKLDECNERSKFVGMSIDDFCRDVIRVEPWKRQREIGEAVARGDRRISIKTGHGVGKTFFLAVVTCWLLACTRPKPVVITTAPSFRQVRDQLWREIRKIWNNTPELRAMAEAKIVKIDLGDKHYAIGFSTNKSGNTQRFQGIHAEALYFVIDEANGFPDYLWEQIDSCLTGDVGSLVAIGNPILPYGKFYNSFRSPNTTKITISSREHPNVISGKELIPGAVTRRWIEDFEFEYRSSPQIIKSRIDGEFPDSATDGIISREWIEAAYSTEPKTFIPRVLSVDIARYGDCLNVASRFVGQRWEGFIDEWGQCSLTTTAKRIMDLYERKPVDYVVIDDSGVGGGVTDILSDQDIPVVPFIAGAKASSDKFFNVTSEAWWAARQAFEGGLLHLADRSDELELQLISRSFSFRTHKGGTAIQVEPKDQFQKRTGFPSPDHADAFIMGLWKVMQVWANSE